MGRGETRGKDVGCGVRLRGGISEREGCGIKVWLKVALSQKVQDSFFIANFVTINIPFFFLKLLHPLHSIDKMSIFKTFTFTCLLYLHVPEVDFMTSTNNFIS